MKTLFHPVISIVAGILILMFPDLLRYVVGIYLIVTGAVALSHRS
ncbi:MAG: DUF3096 domain-containing protein [Prosthecobacter sp.]|nr:DUF3096 domain-containing protein [Prosthecobacter sp.]